MKLSGSDKARYVNKRALTVWLRLCGFEVPQQPVEGLLIHTMRLPASKVANVSGIPNERWRVYRRLVAAMVTPLSF